MGLSGGCAYTARGLGNGFSWVITTKVEACKSFLFTEKLSCFENKEQLFDFVLKFNTSNKEDYKIGDVSMFCNFNVCTLYVVKLDITLLVLYNLIKKISISKKGHQKPPKKRKKVFLTHKHGEQIRIAKSHAHFRKFNLNFQ